MKFFHSRGFFKGEAVERRNLPAQYDGRELDELSLSTTMTSREDVENVISYLELHRFCFDTPPKSKQYPSKEMFND